MKKVKTGKGQIVEGALFATSLAFMNTHLIEQSITKKNRKAIGNRSPYAGPVDMVQTKDGWIVVQVLGDTLFKRWANLIGEEGQGFVYQMMQFQEERLYAANILMKKP